MWFKDYKKHKLRLQYDVKCVVLEPNVFIFIIVNLIDLPQSASSLPSGQSGSLSHFQVLWIQVPSAQRKWNGLHELFSENREERLI